MTRVETNFEKVLREHQELKGLMDGLDESLRAPRPGLEEKGCHQWGSTLAKRLVQLHDKVYVHFREEEESGLLNDLEDRYPHASNAVGELRKDHTEILAGFRVVLGAAMQYSERQSPRDQHLRQQTHALLARLRRHEHAETDLVQRLVSEDLGVSD